MKIERPIYLQKLIDRKNNGMVKIITGMRRCGKSYLLFNLFADYLKSEGIDELRLRGYSVDVGQVIINTKNAEGKSERKILEVDFVCNQGDQRIYVQSAFAMNSEAKENQEFESIRKI